jgi:hypothetical protein
LLWLIAVGGFSSGCAEKPFLVESNAQRAVVNYSADLAGATAIAKRHCASFERLAQFRESGENLAYFDCVTP